MHIVVVLRHSIECTRLRFYTATRTGFFFPLSLNMRGLFAIYTGKTQRRQHEVAKFNVLISDFLTCLIAKNLKSQNYTQKSTSLNDVVSILVIEKKYW